MFNSITMISKQQHHKITHRSVHSSIYINESYFSESLPFKTYEIQKLTFLKKWSHLFLGIVSNFFQTQFFDLWNIMSLEIIVAQWWCLHDILYRLNVKLFLIKIFDINPQITSSFDYPIRCLMVNFHSIKKLETFSYTMVVLFFFNYWCQWNDIYSLH